MTGPAPPRRSRERPRDPWRAAFFATAAAGLAAGAVWALLGPALLVVRQVQVTGTSAIVPRSSVLAAASVRQGSPLITVDTAAVAGRIRKITWVESARVSRKWPDSIVISVRQRTPVCVLAVSSGYLVLDSYGVVLSTARARPADLPLLRLPPGSPGGPRGDPAVLAAGEVVRALPASLRRQVLTVSVSRPARVTLGLRDGITVTWGDPRRSADKVRALLILLRTNARYYDVSDLAVAVTGG